MNGQAVGHKEQYDDAFAKLLRGEPAPAFYENEERPAPPVTPPPPPVVAPPPVVEAPPAQEPVTLPPEDVTSHLSFHVVPQNDLARRWPKVRVALETVAKRTNPSWIQEQIYHVLADGRAFLNLTFYDTEIVGITIVCMDGDQFSGRTDALVLVGWADPRNQQRGIAEAVTVFTQEQIEQRCRQTGFLRLRMHSPRKGWMGNGRHEGLAEKLGYRVQDVVYMKEL